MVRNGLGFPLATLAILGGNVWLTQPGGVFHPLVDFGLTAASMLLILACIGWKVNGQISGVLIDHRNHLSFSRLQTTGWTVLVLSGLAVAASMRFHAGLGDHALDIGIPQNLLVMLGISTTSLVATPVLLGLKNPDPAQLADAENALAAVVHVKDTPDLASWLDIFRGDDVSNADSVDLGKVQQFLVTTGLMAFYTVQLGSWLTGHSMLLACTATATTTGCPVALPDFGQNMAWLLGISHAGYLGYKAAPH